MSFLLKVITFEGEEKSFPSNRFLMQIINWLSPGTKGVIIRDFGSQESKWHKRAEKINDEVVKLQSHVKGCKSFAAGTATYELLSAFDARLEAIIAGYDHEKMMDMVAEPDPSEFPKKIRPFGDGFLRNF